MSYDPVLVSVGDMQITERSLHTPNGSFPLAGTQWMVQNHGREQTKIATWAIVVMIVVLVLFFWTVIGFAALLLLLVRETTYQGYLQVTVYGPGLHYGAQLPYLGPASEAEINARVNYVRGLVSRLQGWTPPATQHLGPGTPGGI